MTPRTMYAWLCGVAAVLALPDAAYACVYGTDFDVSEVPANGLVQLRWQCHSHFCSDKDVPNAIRIVDSATKAEVSGAVVWAHGEGTTAVNIFWKANEPLVAGHTYEVSDPSQSVSGSAEFTVLPAVTWVTTAALELQTNLDLVEDRSAGEISCPSRYRYQHCFLATEPDPTDSSLYTRWQTYLFVSASATHPTGPVPPMKRRSVYWRDGEAPLELTSTPWTLYEARGRITEGAPRYCYRTAVQNLLDGSERVWEGCLEHGDLAPLGTREASREAIAPDTERCAEPPAGFEAEWCEQSMLACRREYTKPAQSDCDNVAKRCAATTEPAAPAAEEDAGASEDDGTAEQRKARKHAARDSGCSIHRGPTGGPPVLLLLAALVAAALRRRKRMS